jgi:hypothetical protein
MTIRSWRYIFHLEIEYDFQKKYYPKELSKQIKEVLNQAFDLHLTNSECDAHSEEILRFWKINTSTPHNSYYNGFGWFDGKMVLYLGWFAKSKTGLNLISNHS